MPRHLSGVPEIDVVLAKGYPVLDIARVLRVPREAIGTPSNIPFAKAELALIAAAGLPVPSVVRNPKGKQTKLENFALAYGRPWPRRAREEEFKQEYHGEFVGPESEDARLTRKLRQEDEEFFAAMTAMLPNEPEPEVIRKSIWEWVRNPAV